MGPNDVVEVARWGRRARARYLLATVVLNYAAALGIGVLVFQYGSASRSGREADRTGAHGGYPRLPRWT